MNLAQRADYDGHGCKHARIMSNLGIVQGDPIRELRGLIAQVLTFIATSFGLLVVVRLSGLTGGISAAALFVVCVLAIYWYVSRKRRAHRLFFEQPTASLGFQPADSSELRLPINPLRTIGKRRNVVRGKLRGLDAWLFDYTIFDGEDTFVQTVLAFQVGHANLPIFYLKPMGLWTGLVERRSADDEYLETIGFSVPCPFEMRTSAKEAVERYFTDDLVLKLARIRDWHCVVQGYRTTILCFIPGMTIPAEELESFVQRSAGVAYEIFSASSRERLLV
jgi:hypothetical protein